MARKAYLHVNGSTYELAWEVNSEQDPTFQGIERRVAALASGGGDQEVFQVRIDGWPADLRVTTQGLVTAAVFVGPEPGKANVIRVR